MAARSCSERIELVRRSQSSCRQIVLNAHQDSRMQVMHQVSAKVREFR
jgi:hypothetical protein